MTSQPCQWIQHKFLMLLGIKIELEMRPELLHVVNSTGLGNKEIRVHFPVLPLSNFIILNRSRSPTTFSFIM